MTKIKKLGFALVLFLVAGFAHAGDADALIELDNQWGNSDGGAALAPLLADGIISVSVDGLRGKAEMVAEADEAESPEGPYEAGDYTVKFLSDDIAVLAHSTPQPEPHWSLHVYQKIDGEWLVVASAGVPVPEEE